MAVGDVISGIFTAVLTWSNFQPSSGVEIILTAISGNGTIYFGLYNGTNDSYSYSDSSLSSAAGMLYGNNKNIKIGITNTNYLRIYASGTVPSYTGIQTK